MSIVIRHILYSFGRPLPIAGIAERRLSPAPALWRVFVEEWALTTTVAVVTSATMGNVNLRNMPDDLVRKAKAAAALRGISLRQLVIEALETALKGEETKRRAGAPRK